MKEYKIASIPGDGIGKEVLPEGIKISTGSNNPSLRGRFEPISTRRQ